jgi:hypothetical protein
LQKRVAQILSEAGVNATVEKRIQTARGRAVIDVWAHDAAATPPQTYLIECKKWRARVPQTVVHAFRTVVGDAGANWGAIVCANGFQAGAVKAAEYSNVRLLTWDEFQALFAERWFSRHFTKKVGEVTDPLIEYTEPINSRIFKKADLLSESAQEEFIRLRETHQQLGTFCMTMGPYSTHAFALVLKPDAPSVMPPLPLRETLADHFKAKDHSLPSSILDATFYRALLKAITKEATAAIAQFDKVFGERA